MNTINAHKVLISTLRHSKHSLLLIAHCSLGTCGTVSFNMTTDLSSAMAPEMAKSSDEKNDQIKMLGLYEEDLNRFGKVLRTMNLDSIPEFASGVRQYGHRSTGNSPILALPESCSINCKIINPPLCGSFHIVFAIEFADGLKWMLKISANGDHFNSIAAAAMTSEAQTMRMLKKETSIPVPTVYAFDTSSNNALSAPFILMEKLGGSPLTHQWFNKEAPKACLEHFRIRTLQSLAGIMVQLNKFTVSTSGSLIFDSDGNPVGLGSAKVMDGVAEFNKAKAASVRRKDDNKGGKITPDRPLARDDRSDAPSVSMRRQTGVETSDNEDIIYERGPFSDPKAYFMSNLDRSDPAFRADAYDRGTDICLRLFIEWAFANGHNHNRRFVLTHPDLDVQNILVADDGTITGLIDWDGVAAVPREIGCTQYPLWLMRDWVPLRYNYDTDNGKVFADAGYQESSPAELASYRALYAQLLELEIAKMTGGSNISSTLGTLPKHEAKLTRRSLIMRNLDLSAGDPWAALSTINHIIDQIEELTAPEWEDNDSDMDSFSSYSSASDPESLDSEVDEQDKGLEPPESDELDLERIKIDVFTHPTEEEMGEIQGVEHTAIAKDSSWKAAEGDHISPKHSKSRQKGSEEPETQESPQVPSAPQWWIRDLLRNGCYAASKSLRTLAEIGHVLGDVDDRVTEELAKVEAPYVEASTDRNRQQLVKPSISNQRDAIEPSRSIIIEQLNDTSSTQDTKGREKLEEVRLTEPTPELPEAPKCHDGFESEHMNSISTIEPQDIPLRKAELLQIARVEKKAERKAHYLADKAAIKKELKIWENIALVVWVRGVSLEQLRLNQGKIASWVAETFQPELENEDDPAANARPQQGAALTAVGSEMANRNALGDDATLSQEKPKKVVNQQAASNLQNPRKVPSLSGLSSVPGAQAKDKAPSSFRALCNLGISYITQMLFSHSNSEEDKDSWRPESSVSSKSGRQGRGSDVGDAQSSVTSVSDGDGQGKDQQKSKLDGSPKIGSANAISEEVQARRKTNSRDDRVGGRTVGEDDNEDAAGEDEGDDPWNDSELPEFVDQGGFDRYTVCNLLGMGELDELRMLRLKDGFLKLLERY